MQLNYFKKLEVCESCGKITLLTERSKFNRQLFAQVKGRLKKSRFWELVEITDTLIDGLTHNVRRYSILRVAYYLSEPRRWEKKYE